MLRLGCKVDELLIEDAEHAVEAAVDLFDALMVERFGDDAGEAGVDYRCGAAGLGDKTVSFELF